MPPRAQKNDLEARRNTENHGIYKGNVADYDATFMLAKKILKSIGLRLTMNDDKIVNFIYNAFFWFNFTNVLISVILETLFIMFSTSGGTVMDLFAIVPCVGYLIVSLCKAYKIKRYRPVFENLVSELRSMWPEGVISKDEYDIINVALKHVRFVIKAYFGCNMTLGSIFTLPSFIALAKRAAGYDEPLLLPFFYWLPFDPFLKIRFQIILILQTYHCFMAAAFMMSGDLLFCIFLSHITTQFSLLSNRIQKLFFVPLDDQLIEGFPLGGYSKTHPKYNRNKSDIEPSNENLISTDTYEKERLKEYIKRHRALIRLSNDVENMYRFSLLVNFMNSSIIICFCLFCCAFVEKWNEFIYKLFFITAILQIWMLCWYGQQLVDKSTGVAEALYNSGWYVSSNKTRKLIFIMISRQSASHVAELMLEGTTPQRLGVEEKFLKFYSSQRDVHVTTYGFSILSLQSYATILKTSWSYFTLLLNMYK